MRCFRVKLCTIGTLESCSACRSNHRNLQSQANAEIWHIVFERWPLMLVLTTLPVLFKLLLVAALAKGHEIQRVFFYHDGVNNATRLTEPPQDDRHVVNRWSALAAEHKVDLVVCVAAALRRGIKDEVLAPGFRISGLGQLVDSGIKADRLITFGD